MISTRPNVGAYPTITVQQLRDELAGYPGDFELSFSGLNYYRIRLQGQRLLQVEFDQQVSRTAEGRVVVVNLD